MNYKLAATKIIEKRRAALADADVLFSDALVKNSELAKVEKQLRSIFLDEAKGNLADKQLTMQLQEKKTELLKSMGIIKQMLEPSPQCKQCNDTAFYNGTYCSCVKSLAINSGENIKIKLNDFTSADFSHFSTEQAQLSKKIFSSVEAITTLYPANNKRNIIVSGPTGTGKTFLAGCAAKKMLERGFSVLAITAFDFVNRALSYHTTFDANKLSYLSPLLDCDFLIIDDLGTESILKNITIEYLYTVLNERIFNNVLTLVTTNLNSDAILDRYAERIYSRLFDKSISTQIYLSGSDLRQKQKSIS